jgi:hypothetical protein
MNTNDLPVAEKLAALIEAGSVSNPGIKHGVGSLARGKMACAMGYALLAVGAKGLEHRSAHDFGENELAPILGISKDEARALAKRVAYMNDHGAELKDIIEAIRKDTLPKVPVNAFDDIQWDALYDLTPLKTIYVHPLPMQTFYSVGVDIGSWGEVKAPKLTVSTIKGNPRPEPAKAVRKSTKTGATWPKPKHAYA